MYEKYQDWKAALAAAPLLRSAPHLTPTPADIEGPFYLPNSPLKSQLCDTPTLCIHGKVMDTSGNPVSALLDFWQADAKGVYDEKGFNFRGRTLAGVDGSYKMETIEPGDYTIGPNEFRCAHVHVKLVAYGYKELTTQLYFNGDPYNATDHWFNPKMVIGNPDGEFDFILEPMSGA